MIPSPEQEALLVSHPFEQSVDPAASTTMTARHIESFRALGATEHPDPVTIEALTDEFLHGGFDFVWAVQERHHAVVIRLNEPFRRLGKGKLLVILCHRLPPPPGRETLGVAAPEKASMGVTFMRQIDLSD